VYAYYLSLRDRVQGPLAKGHFFFYLHLQYKLYIPLKFKEHFYHLASLRKASPTCLAFVAQVASVLARWKTIKPKVKISVKKGIGGFHLKATSQKRQVCQKLELPMQETAVKTLSTPISSAGHIDILERLHVPIQIGRERR
jgi:hypothetical protein